MPLIIATPEMKDVGRTATTPVDYPTLVELSGLQTSVSVSRTSLIDALNNPTKQVRESAFTQFNSDYSVPTSVTDTQNRATMVPGE